MGAPSLSATDILSWVSSSSRPTEDDGIARSQQPEFSDLADRRRALAFEFVDFDKSTSKAVSDVGRSHALWEVGSSGMVLDEREEIAERIAGSGVPDMVEGRIDLTSVAEP
jgi:hypothetical protein